MCLELGRVKEAWIVGLIFMEMRSTSVFVLFATGLSRLSNSVI
jgi:hypothetical protein